MDYLAIITVLGIGFIAGAIFQRGNYLKVLRWQKRIMERQQRQISSMVQPWQ